MRKSPSYETAYFQYVKTNIVRMLLERGGLYTYRELAEMVGLKPTQHFKRRINQMVAEGLLKCTPSFTRRMGIENRFEYFVDMEIKEVTF